MTASPINASKITVMKMAIAMDDVIRIWKSVESSYKIAKRRLAEARSLLYPLGWNPVPEENCVT